MADLSSLAATMPVCHGLSTPAALIRLVIQ